MTKEVFRLHGLPTDIVSDWGPQFISKFWKEFCSLLGIFISLSSGFHPRSDSQSERVNQEVEIKLCLLCEGDPSKWSANLPWVEHAINILPSSSSGLSPFHAVFGFQPPLFSVQGREAQAPSAHQAAMRCQCTWKRARRALLKSNTTYIRGANKRWSTQSGGPQGLALHQRPSPMSGVP